MSRMTKNYCRLYESARGKPDEERAFWTDVQADFEKRNVSPRDFSIRGLFEGMIFDSHGDRCGKEIIESWLPEGGHSLAQLEEASGNAGVVTTSAFSNITGQIVYNEVMAAWNNPAFIADQLVTTVNTSFLDGEKIPGISVAGDMAEAVAEAQPYPLTGLAESWIETPRPVKRGHILPLTREVIIADRTNVLLDRAASISNTMAMNKEKRILDLVMGVTNTWRRNGSAATATYADSTTAPHDFDNVITENLLDYTDIQAAIALFNAMTDPDTGEPIIVTASQLLVSSAELYTARFIVNSTEQRLATASAANVTIGANPLNALGMGGVVVGTPLQILSSPYVDQRVTASIASGLGLPSALEATNWWIGDFKKAFRYMQIWPASVDTLPSNSMWEFTNDIVRAWKISEFGVGAVIEPRYVVMSTAAS